MTLGHRPNLRATEDSCGVLLSTSFSVGVLLRVDSIALGKVEEGSLAPGCQIQHEQDVLPIIAKGKVQPAVEKCSPSY